MGEFFELLNIIKIVFNYVLMGLGIIIAFHIAKYIKPITLWIKGGIEDGDGKLENKELQVAFFSILSAFMIVSVAIWGVVYPDMAYVGVFGGAGLYYTMNRVQNAKVKTKIIEKQKEDIEEPKPELNIDEEDEDDIHL